MKPLPLTPYEPAVWSTAKVPLDYVISDGKNIYSVPFDLIGEYTARVVQHFLSAGREPEQGYKSCASLTKLGDRYGHKRLEAACERVLQYSSQPAIRNISTILKNGQDKVHDAKRRYLLSLRHGNNNYQCSNNMK